MNKPMIETTRPESRIPTLLSLIDAALTANDAAVADIRNVRRTVLRSLAR
jgi:hypothetical protein